MIESLATLIVDESKWLTVSMGLAIVAASTSMGLAIVAASTRVGLEFTGVYGLELALALDHAVGIEVMVINPRAAVTLHECCFRPDYAGNQNDSYWLSNLEAPSTRWKCRTRTASTRR